MQPPSYTGSPPTPFNPTLFSYSPTHGGRLIQLKPHHPQTSYRSNVSSFSDPHTEATCSTDTQPDHPSHATLNSHQSTLEPHRYMRSSFPLRTPRLPIPSNPCTTQSIMTGTRSNSPKFNRRRKLLVNQRFTSYLVALLSSLLPASTALRSSIISVSTLAFATKAAAPAILARSRVSKSS